MEFNRTYLNAMVRKYNHPSFIATDPIAIPHRFTDRPNIEIAGLFAALFAWGNRNTILQKCTELIQRMDGNPHQFITQSTDTNLKQLEGFAHRTLNDTDLLYMVSFLKHWYSKHQSLELAFSTAMKPEHETVEHGLNAFRNTFFSLPHVPTRTFKHIASPLQQSACKRLNMYLRWMVRSAKQGVDFGLWKTIKPAQLICPLDVHVHRTALQFGLLTRKQSDWKAALELTHNLRKLDPKDPVKYDFALFGLSVNKAI
jgi:uncharacterized protein (TIGR02757 family)